MSADTGESTATAAHGPRHSTTVTVEAHRRGVEALGLRIDDDDGGRSPSSVTADTTATTEESGANGTDRKVTGLTIVRDWIIKLVPAVAGAIGVVGFVGFVGGALLWWRFETAGLPANQAIGVVSGEDRLITGAGALLAFLVLGVVAVAVVYAIDPPGRPTGPMRMGLGALIVAETAVAIWWDADISLPDRLVATAVVGVFGAVGWLVSYDPADAQGEGTLLEPFVLQPGRNLGTALQRTLTWPFRWISAPLIVLGRAVSRRGVDGQADAQPTGWAAVQQEARRQCVVSSEFEWLNSDEENLRWAKWQELRSMHPEVASDEVMVADSEGPFVTDYPRHERDKQMQVRRPPKFRWLRRYSSFGIVWGGLVIASTAGALGLVLDSWFIPASFVMACAVAALVFGVCRATDLFWPYGLAVFLSVVMYGAAAEALQLLDSPQGQGAAVVRKATIGPPVVGLYVAKTGDGIWLASVTLKTSADGKCKTPARPVEGTGSLFLVPSAEVHHYAIGDVTDLCTAQSQATHLPSLMQRK